MKKRPVIILYTINSKKSYIELGIYNLKAYLLKYLKVKPKPKIYLKIKKVEPDPIYNLYLNLKDEEINQEVKKIIKLKPNVVGFSCGQKNIKTLLKIANKIKKNNNKIIIVFGGPETYQNPIFLDKKELKKRNEIDIVVRYDGEEAFLKIIQAILYKKNINLLKNIKSISYKNGGHVYINKALHPFNLKKIPSPYLMGLVAGKRKNERIIVENSRGCPYKCAYCSFPLGNFKWLRYFPLNKTLKELSYAFNKKTRLLYLVDNNFNIYPERSKKILKHIINYNKTTKIVVFFNASQTEIDIEFIKLLAKSNINLIIGVQSINPKALKSARRNSSIKILEKNLSNMEKFKINYSLEFIFGLPHDTIENIIKIIDWLFKFRANQVFFYRLLVLEGTLFRKQSKKYKLIFNPYPPFEIKRTNAMNKKEIEYANEILEMTSLFYNNNYLRELLYETHKILKIKYSKILIDYYQYQKKIKINKNKYIFKSFFKYILRKGIINNIGIN